MSSLFHYTKRPTVDVQVGDLVIGSRHPIRVQTMTISKTTDIAATVKETIELAQAGAELVRITVPTIKDAEALKDIRDELRKQGCRVPLCADVHFMPAAALKVADVVEKVRINPGNYADTKRFQTREYSETEYNAELERVFEKFKPLVLKLKESGAALRIGTNHGSLSDRIMNRFGDSPEGMVESALEFIRMCEDLQYRNIVVSMKASNPVVMMAAYRLLANRMDACGMAYPFHLGVTEAGDGEDGRIKSAMGMGTLLMEGLGDTVRVSLTEDSIHEIPVARKLVEPFNRVLAGTDTLSLLGGLDESKVSPYLSSDIEPPYPERRRTSTFQLNQFSLGADHRVAGATARHPFRVEAVLSQAHSVLPQGDRAPEIIQLFNGMVVENSDSHPSEILELSVGAHVGPADLIALLPENPDRAVELVLPIHHDAAHAATSVSGYASSPMSAYSPSPVSGRPAVEEQIAHFVDLLQEAQRHHQNLRASLQGLRLFYAYRLLDRLLRQKRVSVPLVIRHRMTAQDEETALVEYAVEAGGLIADGIGDSVCVEPGGQSLTKACGWSYGLLQAARVRISKADFISCPSCGRTLFDLQTTTERIKSKMGHLKGVKIAIMGCIVNGPGEMADADFGYVGWGPGKINLYVGKECVERNIPEQEADERLIELIRAHGRWVESPTVEHPQA